MGTHYHVQHLAIVKHLLAAGADPNAFVESFNGKFQLKMDQFFGSTSNPGEPFLKGLFLKKRQTTTAATRLYRFFETIIIKPHRGVECPGMEPNQKGLFGQNSGLFDGLWWLDGYRNNYFLKRGLSESTP